MAVYAVAGTLGSFLTAGTPDHVTDLSVGAWMGVIALLFAHAAALRIFERGASWSYVGLGRHNASPGLLSSGFFVGALAIGIPSVLLLVTHQLAVEPASAGSWWVATARSTLFLLPAAFIEELFLRGYIFAVLRESVGWKWTLIGTSITFGLLHLGNPGATPESTMLVITAGFFLGTIVLVTNSLYAAWMAHFAWNWTMAALMHTAVSGFGVATPNYQIVDAGPDWLTGGAWGPEGGLAAGASMIAFTLFFYARHLQRLQRTNNSSRFNNTTLNART
jgi:membrane protease YdiL (CAAX protease family)